VKGLFGTLAAIGAALLSIAPFAALVGLGAHRHAPPWVVSGAAVALVYGPVLLAGALRGRHGSGAVAAASVAWSSTLLLVLPVYFPGERDAGLRTGFGLLGLPSPDGWLPEEPILARPEVAAAEIASPPAAPPADRELRSDQIALPYEGEGRRLSVPVVFDHGGASLEVEMMFDTGATYTTLGTPDLERLGRRPTDADPKIELHTANGVRSTRLVLLDRVWLGDLPVDGVAIAVCDDCGGGDTAGLLGLNVSGGFNVSIDADRREVVFGTRASFDRALDVKPFVDLDAAFTQYPGGRVEVVVTLANHAPRTVRELVATVRCPAGTWTVAVPPVPPGEATAERRKLPEHAPCEQYEIGVGSASW
jgi:hypothetical protein